MDSKIIKKKMTLKLDLNKLIATTEIVGHVVANTPYETIPDKLMVSNLEELYVKLKTKEIQRPDKLSMKLSKSHAVAYYWALCRHNFKDYHGAIAGMHQMQLGSIMNDKTYTTA